MAQWVQRMHERAFANKVMTESWTDQRAIVEPLQTLLRSKKYDGCPLAKHYAVAYLLQAVWTEERLEEAGYNTDGLCPLPQNSRLTVAPLFHM